MERDISEILIPAASIQHRVAELGDAITRDYAGKKLVVIGVLTGAAVFLADLVRHIKLPIELDFVAAASYGNETKSSGEVRLTKDLGHSIHGKHALLTEDIVDSGLTIRYLLDILHAQQPVSISCCALLDKPSRRVCNVEIKYCGFEIEDRFVVGYGLDYAGLYRNLPYIGVLRT